MPDSCYRRSGFFVNDSEETVYGDQGQEVAREVEQKRFIAKREQIWNEGQEVAWPVCGKHIEQREERGLASLADNGEKRLQYEAEREHQPVDS